MEGQGQETIRTVPRRRGGWTVWSYVKGAQSKPNLKLFLKAEPVGFADRWNLGCERGRTVALKVLAGAAGTMALPQMEMGKAGSRAGLGFCRGHTESEVPGTHPHRVRDRCTVEEVQGRVGAGAGIQAGGLLGWRWCFNRQNWVTSPEK